MAFRIGDRAETYSAGDAYFVPPGHVPIQHAGARTRRVQPDRAVGQTIGVRDGQRRAGPDSVPAVVEDVTAVSTFYRVSYAVGFHPWEDLAEHQPFADALLGADRARGGWPPPAVRQGARPRLRQRHLGGFDWQREAGA